MIKLLLLDVDGTLTDGSLYFDENFHEIKAFNVKDGLGMTLWQKLGKKIAIITGRTSIMVKNAWRVWAFSLFLWALKIKTPL